MELRHIPFKKMNGLGNDFVIIDARAEPLRLSAAAAGAIASRAEGAGCDQVIVLEPSRAADVFMRILNADGSEVSACGNASRVRRGAVAPRAWPGPAHHRNPRRRARREAGRGRACHRRYGRAPLRMGPNSAFARRSRIRAPSISPMRCPMAACWSAQRGECRQSALYFLGPGCR